MKKNTLLVAIAIVAMVALTAAISDVPEVITLKGAKKDAVQFTHKAHIDMGQTCKSCHHTLEGDMDMPTQKCGECHTEDHKVKPMKAFHNNCTLCHKKSNKEDGTAAPTKCNDCHTG